MGILAVAVLSSITPHLCKYKPFPQPLYESCAAFGIYAKGALVVAATKLHLLSINLAS